MRNCRIKKASVTNVWSVLGEIDENDYQVQWFIRDFLGAILEHSGFENRFTSMEEVGAFTLVRRKDGAWFVKIDATKSLETPVPPEPTPDEVHPREVEDAPKKLVY